MMKTHDMNTLRFGSFDGEKILMPSSYNSGPEMYTTRQDTIENMRRRLVPDYKMEEFHTRPTANSMEKYKDLNTLNQRVQNQRMQMSFDANNNHNMHQQRKSPPACFAPTTQHASPLPACYVPTTPDEMQSSPECFVPTFHGMPSLPAYSMPTTLRRTPPPAYSAPTTLHRTPPPAYSMPTTPQEMRYPYSTSGHGYLNDNYFIGDTEPSYFSSYGENAVDVAPLQNYDPTFVYQDEMHCLRELCDPVNAQDMIQKPILQTCRPLYDEQTCTLSGQPTNPQQSYRGCGSSSQNTSEYTSECEYCGSPLLEFFRLRTLELFRKEKPKLCKKLDYLSKHLKRKCKTPGCGCLKYRPYYNHFIDLSHAAVKSLQVPRATNSSLNRKRGARGFGRVVGQNSHSSKTHQQELQAPKMGPPQAIKRQPKKQQKAKQLRVSDDYKVVKNGAV